MHHHRAAYSVCVCVCVLQTMQQPSYCGSPYLITTTTVNRTEQPSGRIVSNFLLQCCGGHSPVGNGQSAVNGTLKSSEHLVASSGSGEAGVQVAGEGTWLPVDALNVELVACDLNLALIHLIQAKLVQQLRRHTSKDVIQLVYMLYHLTYPAHNYSFCT